MLRTVSILCALALSTVALCEQVRLIVRLAPGVDPAVLADRHSIRLLDATSPAPFALYETVAGQDEDAIQDALNLDPQVVWAEDDDDLSITESTGGTKGYSVGAIADRGVLYAQNNNALGQVRFSGARAALGSRRVRLAIIDNGLSPNHPRLWSKVVASTNIATPGAPAYDLAELQDGNRNGIPDEAAGHGTMIAGIVDQVAPKVDLVIVKVADSDGLASAWSLLKGLAFAVTEGAEVANISLGSIEDIPALSDFLDWTEENHLLVVAAIGNNGTQMALEPAALSKVVCVAGLDPNSRRAPFSNWESTADVSAPATGIYSTWHDGSMGAWSGTSFAAPFVSGAIADCLRRTRPMRPSSVRGLLRRAGDSIESLNPAYRGKLGVRLNIMKLDTLIRRRR